MRPKIDIRPNKTRKYEPYYEKPVVKKSLMGWVYSNWQDNFYFETSPYVQMALPIIYKKNHKEKHIETRKIRITIEEIL